MESVASLFGASSLALAAAALVAPGLALAGLLPAAVRRTPISRWALAPTLGLAASSVALISVARLGIPLTDLSIRVTLLVLVLIGLAVRNDDVVPTISRDDDGHRSGPGLVGLAEGIAVGGVLALAGVLAWRVVGTLPLPGNDWAKYLLYADEIADHHKLLLPNPFWLGGEGVPFREDPGVPALQGSALIMSGAAAGEAARTIVLLSLASILAVFGAVRASLGPVAGVTAALLVAFVPASQNILGWHGLANVGALAMMPLVFAQLGAWLEGELDRRGEAGLALLLVAVVAAHRLSAAITLAVVGVVLLFRFAAPAGVPRLELMKSVARTLGFGAALGLLVYLDIRSRSATSGGTLPYTNYLTTKLQADLAIRDLSPVLVALAGVTLLWLVGTRRLPRAVWPAAALGVVSIALAYVWVLHLPLYYARMVFYLPYALAPIAGAGVGLLAAWLWSRRPLLAGASVIAIALAAVMVVVAWNQAPEVRRYYAFANPASLRGLDALALKLEPGEPVTTDRCWSFLSAWLLQRPTYPALASQDIGPRAEERLARKGRAMIAGTPEGERLIKQLGVRYALIDPNCPTSAVEVAPKGKVVFVSQRLALVRLSAAP